MASLEPVPVTTAYAPDLQLSDECFYRTTKCITCVGIFVAGLTAGATIVAVAFTFAFNYVP